MKNVTFNTIRPNQTIWHANPHICSTLCEYKVLSSPYVSIDSYDNYFFDAICNDSDIKRSQKVYFNKGTLNKMFYSKEEAENYLLKIRSNSIFLEYDKIRLKEHNLIRNFKLHNHSTKCIKLEKKVIEIFKIQDFELPKAI